LNPDTTWYFDVQPPVFGITGGQIAYSVTTGARSAIPKL
jgi:hypothetical protein